MSDAPGDVTRLLGAAARGDEAASERLWSAVYEELRGMARRELGREAPGRTLSTTGLVHEAYLKLVDADGVSWADRGHFLAVACRAMRQVLVDRARTRRALKRGGGQRDLTLESQLAKGGPEPDLLVLDEALERMERHEARLARVVDLHFFGGLSLAETADALGGSLRTTERDWARAKAWLRVLLEDEAR